MLVCGPLTFVVAAYPLRGESEGVAHLSGTGAGAFVDLGRADAEAGFV
jgi:hypothetical protein